MAARLCGYQGDRAVLHAAVVEFIHTATLVHDDIIDDSEFRRGRLAVHSQWGNDITVLLGDFLYIKSMSLALSQDSLEIVRLLCDVTLRMIEGELYQLTKNGDIDITEDEHFDIIRRKTAYLFAGCAQIGGMLGDSTPEQQGALREYGFNLGIAFQLMDDLLDFTGDAAALGKPVGGDLREGKVTLPIIRLLAERRPGRARAGRRRRRRAQRHAGALGRDHAAAASVGRARLRARARANEYALPPARSSPRSPMGPSATRLPRSPITSCSEIGDRRDGLEFGNPTIRNPQSAISDSADVCPLTASTSFAERIRHHEERYYVHDDPGDRRRRVRRADARAAGARGGASRPRDARFADPARRRRPVEGFATVEHRAPMLSLDNAYNEDELRAFDERVRKGLGRPREAGDVRRRAQDRRPEHRADV